MISLYRLRQVPHPRIRLAPVTLATRQVNQHRLPDPAAAASGQVPRASPHISSRQIDPMIARPRHRESSSPAWGFGNRTRIRRLSVIAHIERRQRQRARKARIDSESNASRVCAAPRHVRLIGTTIRERKPGRPRTLQLLPQTPGASPLLKHRRRYAACSRTECDWHAVPIEKNRRPLAGICGVHAQELEAAHYFHRLPLVGAAFSAGRD